jgi:hypothetical protein
MNDVPTPQHRINTPNAPALNTRSLAPFIQPKMQEKLWNGHLHSILRNENCSSAKSPLKQKKRQIRNANNKGSFENVTETR